MMQNIITVTVSFLVWKLFTRWLPLFVAGVKLGLMEAELRRLHKEADGIVEFFKNSEVSFKKALEIEPDVKEQIRIKVIQAALYSKIDSDLKSVVSEMEHLKIRATSERQFINELATKKGLL